MNWDLGSKGLRSTSRRCRSASDCSVKLISARAAPKWLWAPVSVVYFGVGILVSEFWFGSATEKDLQPNIDGLSPDEVLLVGLFPVAAAVVGNPLAGSATRSPCCRRAGGIDGRQSPASASACTVIGVVRRLTAQDQLVPAQPATPTMRSTSTRSNGSSRYCG
jgi:hypothetical protein